MSNQTEDNGESLTKVVIVCPKCQTKEYLKLPKKVINQSKQLTTISIPSTLVCEHSFQAFVDKNFKVRGYQMVDFAFSKLEFLEKEEGEDVSLPEFEEIVNLLRGTVDDKDVLGSAILTVNGKVLYSSLPQNTLFSTIKEFEVRSEQKLVSVQKMFLEFDNQQKICSEFMELNGVKFILVLFFSNKIKFGLGNLVLRELVKKINLFA